MARKTRRWHENACYYACCLMTNHFHLELTTRKEPIWKIMKPVMQNYAMWFNQRYGYVGHVFDSRYTSCMIEDDRYFIEVSRYIHLNPVKAQMARSPLDYKHSSYALFVSNETKIPDGRDHEEDKIKNLMAVLVDTDRILGAFRHNPREQYRMFVEGIISHAEQEMLIQKYIENRWCLFFKRKTSAVILFSQNIAGYLILTVSEAH